MHIMGKIRGVISGGGHGGTRVARGLLSHEDVELSSLPTMADSGFSSGKLRALGIQPPGDFRQYAEVHLQGKYKDTWAGFLSYRYPPTIPPLQVPRKRPVTGAKLLSRICNRVWGQKGEAHFRQICGIQSETLEAVLAFEFPLDFSFGGHSGGNLLYFICEKQWGRQIGHQRFTKLLNIRGEVWPITLEDAHLHARLSDREVLTREHEIDQRDPWDHRWVEEIWLEPKPHAHIFALEATRRAEFFVWPAGDALTSICVNRLVGGLIDTLKESSALVVVVINLMTKAAETPHWRPQDFLKNMFRYGRERDKFDAVFIHTGGIPLDALVHYKEKERAGPVLFEDGDVAEVEQYAKHIITGNFLDERHLRETGFVRHDSDTIGEAIMKFVRLNRPYEPTWVFDLDDTLAIVPRGSEENLSSVINIELVPGARDVLQAKKNALILTAGPKSLQQMKVNFLKLDEFIPEEKIILVENHEGKRGVIQEVVEKVGDPSKVVIVGDNLDAELAIGQELGCTTVRVCLPGALRANQKPKNGQRTTFTVTSLTELLALSIY